MYSRHPSHLAVENGLVDLKLGRDLFTELIERLRI